MNNLLTWMVLGLVSGLIIHFVDYRSLGRGLFGTMFTGIIGALMGGLLANILLGEGVTGFNVFSLAIALVGGLILSAFQRDAFRDTREEIKRWKNQGVAYFSEVTPIGGYYEKGKKKGKKAITLEYLVDSADYPISKSDLLRYAERHGANEELLSKLEALPDHIYDSSKQLRQALHI